MSMMGSAHYPLGNGYRLYDPVIMRFNKPDNMSPFGAGGLNAYVYCKGDPANYEDSTGHMPRGIAKKIGAKKRGAKIKPSEVTQYRPKPAATHPIAGSRNDTYYRDYVKKNRDTINARSRERHRLKNMDMIDTNERYNAMAATGQLDYTFTHWEPTAQTLTLDAARRLYTNARDAYADALDVDNIFMRTHPDGPIQLDTWRFDAIIDGANGILRHGFDREVTKVRNRVQAIRQKNIMKNHHWFPIYPNLSGRQ
jgi:RHS repeat-associated protein